MANLFAKQHSLNICGVDAGMKSNVLPHPRLISAKITDGTQDFLSQPAMTLSQCHQAINAGADIVLQRYQHGCNCIGFGGMGVNNTLSATLLMYCATQLHLDYCFSKDGGVDIFQFHFQKRIVQKALKQHGLIKDPMLMLSTYGGLEIAMLVGAYLKAAELGMVIMVDGFVASTALKVASLLYPHVLEYCIFSHVSGEDGHCALLHTFSAQPLLSFGLHLEEGCGIALAYPLLQAMIRFLNDMPLETADVSHGIADNILELVV